MENIRLSVTDFVELTNQTLEYAYSSVELIGEVQSFKVNQGKFVFFDIKDEGASVGCFMTVWQLRIPIEDGMKVLIRATPKLTKWGKFSLTVATIAPLGEGSLKRGFDLLKAKLEKEGLFGEERKRALPQLPSHIGVISSKDSAGYADFIKIINERWGGLSIETAHVQVQGSGAADQIIKALQFFNQAQHPPEVIVIMRGGGSVDDLSVFNDEPLVRAVASSRIPTITGIGHETDTTLIDLVSDIRAATPSNVAQLIVPDKREIMSSLRHKNAALENKLVQIIDVTAQDIVTKQKRAVEQIGARYQQLEQLFAANQRLLSQLSPEKVLRRGYAIVTRDRKLADESVRVGDELRIEVKNAIIRAGVIHVETRK